MNPRYPSLPDRSVADVGDAALNCFTKLSASTFVRTHVAFGIPEKMSSSTSTRAGIDSLPPVLALGTVVLPVGAGEHPSAKKTHATRIEILLRWPTDISP